MFKRLLKFVTIIGLFILLFLNNTLAQIIEKIEITGNERVSRETIIMFTGTKLNDQYRNLQRLISGEIDLSKPNIISQTLEKLLD